MQKTCRNEQKTCKNVQKRAKTCKNVQKRAANVDLIKKRASQGFLDPIQNRALSRSVQLKAVYLEALLYSKETESKDAFLCFFVYHLLSTAK